MKDYARSLALLHLFQLLKELAKPLKGIMKRLKGKIEAFIKSNEHIQLYLGCGKLFLPGFCIRTGLRLFIAYSSITFSASRAKK